MDFKDHKEIFAEMGRVSRKKRLEGMTPKQISDYMKRVRAGKKEAK